MHKFELYLTSKKHNKQSYFRSYKINCIQRKFIKTLLALILKLKLV